MDDKIKARCEHWFEHYSKSEYAETFTISDIEDDVFEDIYYFNQAPETLAKWAADQKLHKKEAEEIMTYLKMRFRQITHSSHLRR